MVDPDGSLSVYFFAIDDNLFFLPTNLYAWNAEHQTEQSISSDDFARIQNDLGRAGQWQAWAVREETFRNFRDRGGTAAEDQPFFKDLLVHAAAELALHAH